MHELLKRVRLKSLLLWFNRSWSIKCKFYIINDDCDYICIYILNRISLLCLSDNVANLKLSQYYSFHTQETLVSFLLSSLKQFLFLHISYGNLHCAFIYFTKIYIVHKEKKIVFDFTHFLNQSSTYVLFVVVPSSFSLFFSMYVN